MHKSTLGVLLPWPGNAEAIVQGSTWVFLAQSILQPQTSWDANNQKWTCAPDSLDSSSVAAWVPSQSPQKSKHLPALSPDQKAECIAILLPTGPSPSPQLPFEEIQPSLSSLSSSFFNRAAKALKWDGCGVPQEFPVFAPPPNSWRPAATENSSVARAKWTESRPQISWSYFHSIPSSFQPLWPKPEMIAPLRVVGALMN